MRAERDARLRKRVKHRGVVTRFELGRVAELAVADYLFAAGFDLLARNFRLGALELDVIARKGALLVVAEVRTRGPGAFVGAFESVTRAKRARLLNAVERLWRERRDWMAGVERVRIDVAAVFFVAPDTRVEYVEAAIAR
jgi:putative endonuclease